MRELISTRIDQERNNLTSKTTAVTKERFDEWLIKRKIKQREARELRIQEENRQLGYGNIKRLSGRELFN